MNTKDLQRKIKPTIAIYFFWLLLGSHYAYQGRWSIQILFWISLGGLGVWAIIDLITMSDKIVKHREMIFQHIEEIENKEKVKHNLQHRIEPGIRYEIDKTEPLIREKAI